MGGMLLAVGELAASRDHFNAALAAYDEDHPQRTALGSDLGVFAHAWSTHALWLLGDEAGALSHAEQAVVLARRRQHLYSETLALAYAALLHQMRLDAERTLETAQAVVALCERYGFAYYGDWASVLIGWARGEQHPAEGVTIIESALRRLDAHRAFARRPYYLSLLAQTYARLGQRDRTASILDQAIAMAHERGDMWWLPALYLQKSELQTGSERDALLQRALALARAQGSRALEQRILASSVTASI
jgi:tetratricopeptide (TPR) repeat protein